MRSPFRHLEISGNGTTIRDRREEATGTQYIHPITRFPSIIVIGGKRLSGKACLTIVGWVQPTAFSGELVGCTHPTKSFPDSL